MKFDLLSISDAEFEDLCCDIISVKFFDDVKRGRKGKDSGIDGILAVEDGNVYLQAKRYKSDGYLALKRVVETTEAAKAQNLKSCARYFLMTTCELSAPQRAEIVKLYGGVIKSENDIWSGEDIRATLEKPEYRWVLRRHYNLWLSGVDALESFLGDGNDAKSEALLADIQEDLKHAVILEWYDAAVKKLEENRVIVITGQAGTGKTTLAKQLVVDYVFNKGYKFVASDYDIGIFERQLSIAGDTKMLFYLDDFLGSNCLNAIVNNRDSQIVNFIRRIRRNDKCAFILTIRTNIIREAADRYRKIAELSIEEMSFQIVDSKICRIDKAKILYNQMFFGDVEEEAKVCVAEDENFFKVIDHRNFNPRIISYCFSSRFITDALRNGGNNGIKRILWMLDNPSEIWRDCFESLSLNEFYLGYFVFLGGSTDVGVLSEAYKRMLGHAEFSEFRGVTCEQALRKLNTSILSASVRFGSGSGGLFYQLFNPSVGDYIIRNYGSNDGLMAEAALMLESKDVVMDICSRYLYGWSFDSVNVETKKSAGRRILNMLAHHAELYDADFILGVHDWIPAWRENDCKAWKTQIGIGIASHDIIFRPNVDSKLIARYLHWSYDNNREALNVSRLTKEFLDALYDEIDRSEELAMLNRIYVYRKYTRPEGYTDKIIKFSSEWAEKIAGEGSWDEEDTAERINDHVMDEIWSVLRDCDLDENIDVCDLCCEFNPEAYTVEVSEEISSGGFDNEPNSSRDYEDGIIRRMFERYESESRDC